MVQKWDKDAAQNFITMADIVIPDRQTQFAIVAESIPFSNDHAFKFIDIGCGEGFLTKSILDAFPRAVAHTSDVSEEMLSQARQLLQPYNERVKLSQHNIHQPDYLENIVAGRVGFITSSLAIHHCDDAEKRALYKAAFNKLSSPGGFVISDAVRPTSAYGVRLNKRHWQESIRRQSLALTGKEEEYHKYKEIPIMFYDQPTKEDKPATLVENLSFLAEAGFENVDCFWHKCGFAIFGGYKGIR